MDRQYYEAYDDRYRQIHKKGLRWFYDKPSAIVSQIIDKYAISKENSVLELGCGEGRDAAFLLSKGYDLLATDISGEAVDFCVRHNPVYADHFQILDCVAGAHAKCYDFIYAVAVVHMLVEDRDRDGFYRFIRQHLNPGGKALICSMGDGELESKSDICSAFMLQDRIHEQTGTHVRIAGTSCRIVGFHTFEEELQRNGLTLLEKGMTAIEPDFSEMMYAVVEARNP